MKNNRPYVYWRDAQENEIYDHSLDVCGALSIDPDDVHQLTGLNFVEVLTELYASVGVTTDPPANEFTLDASTGLPEVDERKHRYKRPQQPVGLRGNAALRRDIAELQYLIGSLPFIAEITGHLHFAYWRYHMPYRQESINETNGETLETGTLNSAGASIRNQELNANSFAPALMRISDSIESDYIPTIEAAVRIDEYDREGVETILRRAELLCRSLVKHFDGSPHDDILQLGHIRGLLALALIKFAVANANNHRGAVVQRFERERMAVALDVLVRELTSSATTIKMPKTNPYIEILRMSLEHIEGRDVDDRSLLKFAAVSMSITADIEYRPGFIPPTWMQSYQAKRQIAYGLHAKRWEDARR